MLETMAAKAGYAQATRSAGTPRGIEYQIFARVTHALASEHTGPSARADLAKAALENLKLWTLIAADVAGPRNGLPAELRSKLFYLSEFTRRHTAKLLQGEAQPDVLVDINRSVMRGLRPGAEREES